jgi:acetyltransferase-like isoleucine patch superfamily enzyme
MIKAIKKLLRRVVLKICWFIFLGRTTYVYRLWGLEGISRICLSCNPKFIGWLLKRHGAEIGEQNDFNSPLLLHNFSSNYSNLAISNQCHLGKGVFLDLRDKITVEDKVTISMRTTILTHQDLGQSPIKKKIFPTQHSPVVIKKGAYVGAGAIILQGVTVGKFSVVGAGSVVTRSVPDFALVTGVPAKFVRSLTFTNNSPLMELE